MNITQRKNAFATYQLFHQFEHGTPLKASINENNFSCHYVSDWLWLMPIVEKIKQTLDSIPDNKKLNDITCHAFLNLKIYTDIKEVCFICECWIKWYNKLKF